MVPQGKSSDKPGDRSWAFGSSTPRDFAHLTALKPALRRYDAVLPKKSNTTPNFMATPIRRSATVAPVARQPPAKPDTQRNEQIGEGAILLREIDPVANSTVHQ